MNISVFETITVEDGVLADRDFPTGVIGIVCRGQEVTRNIVRSSVRIENILSRQVDTCTFTVKQYGSFTFIPAVGNEVKIFNGADKIFAGNIVEINQTSQDYAIIEYSVKCNDYGRQLDRYLINDTFESKTVAQIINSIVDDKGLGSEGFTTSGVTLDDFISYVGFKYEPLSSVLNQLADILNADWYVDYNRVIHFFGRDDDDAPFGLTDSDGSYIFDSLKIRRDNTQIKNVVYVRGGEFLGDTFTTQYISDGTQNVYPLPYRYEDIRVSVTGTVWDGGVDGTDNILGVDYIWNKIEKFIRFRGDRVPSNTSTVRVSGQPFIPVIVKLKDQRSITTMMTAEGGSGQYEHVVIDPSINSKEGARERARAELDSYKDTLSEGGFATYNTGLRAGQRIHVDSDAHGIDEHFIINKVIFNPWTENDFMYDVSFVTTKSFGIIDFLRSLITKEKKNIIINDNEILDTAESLEETLTIAETSVAMYTAHNSQTETMTMVETTVTAQSLNYPVYFVLGPLAPPTGHNRVFIVSNSYLS